MVNNVNALGSNSKKVLNNKAMRALNTAFGAGISKVEVDTIFNGALDQNQNANVFLADVSASSMLEVGEAELKEFESYFCNLLKVSGDEAFSEVGLKDCQLNFFLEEDHKKIANMHAANGWTVNKKVGFDCYKCPDDDLMWPDDDDWKRVPLPAPAAKGEKKASSSWLW